MEVAVNISGNHRLALWIGEVTKKQPQATQPASAQAVAPKVWEIHKVAGTKYHFEDLPLAVNQDSDFPSEFSADLAYLPGKFERHHLISAKLPAKKALCHLALGGAKTFCISLYFS